MTVLTKIYSAPPLCEREILRYAGCKTAQDDIVALMRECIALIEGRLTYKVCYQKLPVTLRGAHCDFGAFEVRSAHLSRHLQGCTEVLLFAATVGVEMDRLIHRYSSISPSKALMLQAIGAQRIEALCDAFCADMEREYGTLTSRFSAGYGDLKLECQRDIFSLLEPQRKIGLTLTDGLTMSPSKSVTAFVGLGGKPNNVDPCSACNMKHCTFRGDK